MVLVLAAGTIVQRIAGADTAIAYVYHSWWFAALWIAITILCLVAVARWHLVKRPATLGIHIAFVLIVTGMIVTAFTAQSGSITMAPRQQVAAFSSGQHNYTLPFSIRLDDFSVVYYPGTQSPQDYVSTITLNGLQRDTISMNHICRYKGYRIYQSGYTSDGNVTLTVTHDPWGTGMNYCGYLLLLISMSAFFFDSHSRFRQLLRGAAALLPLLLSVNATAGPRTLPSETASHLGRLCVYYQGRVCPVSTLAKDFTTKLYGAPSYKGLSSEQVLSGWIFYYSDWSQEPIFKIKGRDVRTLMHSDEKYVSLNQFFDNNSQYILRMLDTLSLSDKRYAHMMAANEKYQLITMLYGGQMLKIFPLCDSAGAVAWYSQSDKLPLNIADDEYLFIRKSLSYAQELVALGDVAALDTLIEKTILYQQQRGASTLPSPMRLKAEQIYNSVVPRRMVSILCILIGLSLFVALLVSDYKPSLRQASIIILGIEGIYLSLLFVLRWFVAGHAPLSNGYETMLFLSMVVALLGLLFSQRLKEAPSVGLLLTGVFMMVAMMGGSSPMITHLMPVLQSPLLCIHVAVIMLAYALLAMIAILSATALIAPLSIQHSLHLQRVCQIVLYPAVFLLTIGIFIGAVWANVSWGTYWSWDPKEVWALITLMVYAVLLHGRSIGRVQNPRFFFTYCLVAFLCVIITYFGVNFFLGGMHSYA